MASAARHPPLTAGGGRSAGGIHVHSRTGTGISTHGLGQLPELEDADYLRDVLGRDDGTMEADIDLELQVKAKALGVEMPGSAGGTPVGGAGTGQQSTAAGSTSTGTCTDTAINTNTTISTDSEDTTDTNATTLQASDLSAEMPKQERQRNLSFSQYEPYLSKLSTALDQPKMGRPAAGQEKTEGGNGVSPGAGAGAGGKTGSRRGVRGFTRGIAAKLRRKKPSPDSPMPCICCREEFTQGNGTLHTLPCGHCYCRDCLAIMVDQSITDESKMPPRCCAQPFPSAIIKLVLPREKHQLFLKTVVQYSTPWEARVFCPNPTCGEFIPPIDKSPTTDKTGDSQHHHAPPNPFEAFCRHCQTRACLMCKRFAHQPGQDCPEDRESDAVLKMGERSGWRRCYKCRSLIELDQGCTHITCRCKAQFCYICGAVWSPTMGCPNFCNGEEEMERRRVEEAARLAEREAEKAAREKAAAAEAIEQQAAEARTRAHPAFQSLRARQAAEKARFDVFEQRAKDALQARQTTRKRALHDKFEDLMDRMRERHAKTEQHLEDRQVLAEIELQASLEEKAKKVRIKLKYMEDYCNGRIAAAPSPSPYPSSSPVDQQQPPSQQPSQQQPEGSQETQQTQQTEPPVPAPILLPTPLPQRHVTDRDLEQLRQQYCVRDGMARRHLSQIHGLREKQAKAMEELTDRHEREMDTLAERRATEMEDLAGRFSDEEEALLAVFGERRGRLARRWRVEAEVVRKEVEGREGVGYAVVEVPRWVEEETTLGEEGRGIEGGRDDNDGDDDTHVRELKQEELRDIRGSGWGTTTTTTGTGAVGHAVEVVA
ncbi:uncharacterized protein C8A04DRAFT_10430 [Dichotomopilus funicola]|uniref:RBR-type E3 ubiquitin transferase n=1 Tax=Dichotomopilus funicola TaxID=1934379 RepID=A0AAN6V6L3_9PEZI|nr:hypothetical protein C8A04DRAFT_10430 [Dichotomopilus funicola]